METYKTVCFTGHRKIGTVYDGPEEARLQNFLVGVVQNAVKKGFRNFISGGAIGVDQVAARAVLKVRSVNNHRWLAGPNDIYLIIAQPFPSQAVKWPERIQNRYQAMLNLADKVYPVSQDPYSADKMDIRNKFMVNNSDAVIAVWNGVKKGGTWNCLQYARKQNKDILIIHPTTLVAGWVKQTTHTGGNTNEANSSSVVG